MKQRAMLSKRLAALRALCKRRGVSTVLLTDGPNVRYFSGFSGEDSCLLVARRWVRLVTDSRFAEQARIECPQVKAIVRSGRMSEAIASALAGRRVRRLGIEGMHMPVAMRAALEGAIGKGKTKPLGGEIDALREVKDAAELRAIRRAVRAAERAFLAVTARGARGLVGKTENRLAAELDYQMRLAGAERAAFETIVAAGAHAALPHYRPGGTKIRRGDAVLIDWGAVVAGYCCDLTRVVFVGRIPPQIVGIYEVVLRAQQAGMRALAPGVKGSEADGAARDVIDSAGHGKAFGHGLGHGLGLKVHEGPGLARRTQQKLAAGMVVTVEPGIYLPGVGGVRIEDDVLVTPAGRQRLSRLPREASAMLLR